MIPVDDLILLDTNIILQLVRKNIIGQKIESDYKIRHYHPNRSIISIITVGEMYALSLKFNWGKQKIARMNELLNAMVIIDISEPDIVENYARINYYSEKIMKPARPMGQNDIWIAATSLGAWLMTTDDDFEHLHPKYIQRIPIEANTGETRV